MATASWGSESKKNDMQKKPRIILYAGKGGVGKTSIAAATALRCARQGHKTIVISLDLAHSLSDSFDLSVDLYDTNKGDPVKIEDNLWIQEIDIHREIERHWGDIYKYFSLLLNNAGLDEVVAEELAVIPGMEDIVFLLYINRYVAENQFDVLILDCAPTGESLRFVSMPSTFAWYMNKVYRVERGLARLVRPVAKIMSDVPLPEDNYFKTLQELYRQLKGVDKLLLDREITSIRLVTNAEKMVVRETQRAFMYFSMFGMLVDSVIINRLMPQEIDSEYFKNWALKQKAYADKIKDYFEPVPVKSIPIFNNEITGISQLDLLGKEIFQENDPAGIFFKDPPYSFITNHKSCKIEIKLPGIKKGNVDLLKNGEELIVKVGNRKRYIMLPRMFAKRQPSKAKFEGEKLCVYFEKKA